jgi:hypothetical protein
MTEIAIADERDNCLHPSRRFDVIVLLKWHWSVRLYKGRFRATAVMSLRMYEQASTELINEGCPALLKKIK